VFAVQRLNGLVSRRALSFTYAGSSLRFTTVHSAFVASLYLLNYRTHTNCWWLNYTNSHATARLYTDVETFPRCLLSGCLGGVQTPTQCAALQMPDLPAQHHAIYYAGRGGERYSMPFPKKKPTVASVKPATQRRWNSLPVRAPNLPALPR